MATENVIIEGRNLSKEFSGNVVLEDVSIRCSVGETIALSGENGAGKSTLMNILSGGLKPSAGSIYVDGAETKFKNSSDAKKKGIAFVHQELSLMMEMTAGENILIGNEPKKGMFIDQKELHKKAAEILEYIGFKIDVNLLVKDLSPAERQMVEIAKAWANQPRLMIFDEPTSSLNKEESDILFDFIHKIKKAGVCSVLISHRMDDIFTVCDRVIVLKDGCFVFEAPTKETNVDELISKMVGRTFENLYPEKNEKLSDEIKLELKDVAAGSKLNNVSLKVPKGSVIGIGGLEGQGQRELARALFGIEPFKSGDYIIDGKAVNINSPVTAVKHKIAFVSDDRKGEGLYLQLSSGENIVSLVLDKHQKGSVLNRRELKQEVIDGINELKIKVSGPEQLSGSLSGGNQQKIIFSKWLKTKPEILILDEPTRGIDVQSKIEIYQLIRNLTKTGVSVIVFTSDMLELIGISDNIYILYEGRVAGELSGMEATEEKLMLYSANQAERRETV